jgi:ATP-dependent exoDNAse (exonuclease V) beta subunit
LQRLRLEMLPQAATADPAPRLAEEIAAAEANYLATSNLAPHIGTLVHRYLELIAKRGVDAWDAARVASLRPAFEKWLQQQGHTQAEIRQGTARVAAALSNAVSAPQARWILQARGAQSASELALTQLDQGALRNHIVDRSFIEDGVRWIIDYKTGAHEGSAVESFIAAKCLEYAAQLERYALLFQHEGLPIRKAIYFADLNRFEVLPE